MQRLRSILGYSGAALTMTLAVLTPFFLYGWFQKGIGGLGLRIDPVYSGGEVSHVIQRDGYRIVVNRPVYKKSPLQRVGSFVQVTWTPAAGLPARVADDVDLDGDGKPDLRVQFDVPKNQASELEADVTRPQPAHIKGIASFDTLIARVKDGIVVRFPL
jgi:hypothetical protein